MKEKQFRKTHIQLLANGVEYFPALLKEIKQAKEEIYLQSYIYANDAVGKKISAALIQSAQRGVVVYILLDGIGSGNIDLDLQNDFQKAGIQLLFYRPPVFKWFVRQHFLRRLHRKVVVIDQRVGFIGGINIIDDDNVPKNAKPRIDYAVRLEGGIVEDLHYKTARLWRQTAFWYRMKFTKYAGKYSINIDNFFQVIENSKNKHSSLSTKTVSSLHGVYAGLFLRDNLSHRRDIENAYLGAIHKAKQSILIANAYFLPAWRFRHALIEASKRGVKVQLILQGRVESSFMTATHALYSAFLREKIEIFEHRKSFIHAKVAVIDDIWATVGSANIDPISSLFSLEANVVVRNRDFVQQLKKSIEKLRDERTTPIYNHLWIKRGLLKRVVSWIVYGIYRMGFHVLS